MCDLRTARRKGEAIMATDFTEGVKHDHKASRRWSEVQKNPNSPGAPLSLVPLCKKLQPSPLVSVAKYLELWDMPLARRHVDWYLKESGKDFDEN